jgi:hypothetical protein
MRQFNELLAAAVEAMRGNPASVEVQVQQCEDIARLAAVDDKTQAAMVHVLITSASPPLHLRRTFFHARTACWHV